MKELLGYAAAVCTTLSFVPQVVRVWTTRSAADLSLGMYSAFAAGVALWVAYGFAIRSFPVIAANSTTLVLAGAVIVGKLKFDRR